MSPTDESVIHRAPVLWRQTTGAVLVRPPEGDAVVKLTGTGVALWDALSGPVSFAQLCLDLADDHRAPVETVRADLGPVVDDLAIRGVVVVD